MGRYNIDQIKNIIKLNPAKDRISKAREQAKKLMFHLHGHNKDQYIKKDEYFENDDVHKSRNRYAVSNQDMYGRLLQQEDMVFSAKGGSSYFGLPAEQEQQMNAILEDVRYGLPLRKWMRNFALPAYRVDPMGIIFIEVEAVNQVDTLQVTTPKAYPTYKSSFSIYDYDNTGRRLEYVCFRLKASEARQFKIKDVTLKDMAAGTETTYYRFIDDEKDVIVKCEQEITIADAGQPNPIVNIWERTPGFMISDLMCFDDPAQFQTPLHLTVELADTFFEDRSVRNVQKKFHGFAKGIEPLLSCASCAGTGLNGGNACPDCAKPGMERGTGFKMRTRVGDVARFPMSVFEKDGASGFDFKKIFGYVTPDVEGWDKQDMSLEDLEELIEMTYWGTVRLKRNDTGKEKTAEEVASNNKPKEARLNMTADWAESTENMIADLLGRFWFDTRFKKSSIAYGRNYILETPAELREQYVTLCKDGAPEYMKDEALQRYYHAVYQNNPVQLTKHIKLMKIEPFVHHSVEQVKGWPIAPEEILKKVYFNEWLLTLNDEQIVGEVSIDNLRAELDAYVAKKPKAPLPEPKPNPINN